MTMKSVLLTGATGVLGRRVLAELLYRSEVEIYILVRGKSLDHAQGRTIELLNGIEKEFEKKIEHSRVITLLGDISKSRLGLSEEDWKKTLTLESIIHAAADISLDLTEDEADKNILSSIRELLKLQEAIEKNGHQCRLEYVSTVGVLGKSLFPLHEEIIFEQRDFNNNYEKYKAKSEELLLEVFQSGKKIAIHRPSMIVGDSVTGAIPKFQIFYFILSVLTGYRSYGVLPDILNYKIDTIPVDIVASAIVQAALTNSDQFIFNHCSSVEESLTLSEFRALLIEKGAKVRPLKIIPRKVAMAIIFFISIILSMFNKSLSERLSLYVSILKYGDSIPQFVNIKTKEFYAQNGIIYKSPKSYMANIIQYYVSIRKRKMEK